MGQQQFLLLVGAVIIIGFAIIVGIRAFEENAVRSNADVLVQEVMEIAKTAIAWKETPPQMGGQAPGSCKSDPACFRGINFAKLGYGVDGNPFRYENTSGEFFLVERGVNLGLKACNPKIGNKVIIEFRGLDPDSLVLVDQAIGTDPECSG